LRPGTPLTTCTLTLRVTRSTVLYAIRPELHGETLAKTLALDCEVAAQSDWIEQRLVGTRVDAAVSNGLKRANDLVMQGKLTYAADGELIVSIATRDEPFLQLEAFARNAEGLTLEIEFGAPASSHVVSLFGPMPVTGFTLQGASKGYPPQASLRLVDTLA